MGLPSLDRCEERWRNILLESHHPVAQEKMLWPALVHGSKTVQAAQETAWIGLSLIFFFSFGFLCKLCGTFACTGLACGFCDHQARSWAKSRWCHVLSCMSGCSETISGAWSWKTYEPPSKAKLSSVDLWETTALWCNKSQRTLVVYLIYTQPIAQTPPCGFFTQPKIPRHTITTSILCLCLYWASEKWSMISSNIMEYSGHSHWAPYGPASPWHCLGFPGSWGKHLLNRMGMGVTPRAGNLILPHVCSMWMTSLLCLHPARWVEGLPCFSVYLCIAILISPPRFTWCLALTRSSINVCWIKECVYKKQVSKEWSISQRRMLRQK